MNKANLQKMIDEKCISVQKHPTLDLYIYNYTQKAQFDRVWNEETLQCRGLIMDGQGNVVARPFRKFFNYAEAIQNGEQIPAEDFIVTEKYDGSLGILYWEGDKPFIATRGSFVSDQAYVGSTYIQSTVYRPFINRVLKSHTYLFEIIYPENRIVVDYGGMKDLVLLAVIDTETGKEESYNDIKSLYGDFIQVAQKYDGITDLSKVEERPNSEGYVITFLNGQRYKVKFEEYVRLHRLVTGVNARSIWDILRSGGNMDELLDRVPDEFFKWVHATKSRLEKEYKDLRTTAGSQYVVLTDKFDTRKEIAIFMNTNGYSSVLKGCIFAMLDNKPEETISSIIWKALKPKHEVPFKEDIDA